MTIRAGLLLFALILACAHGALAQGAQPAPSVPPLIQDNSFLMEEAYNQEAGIVQHISSFIRMKGGAWAYSFTQEWPAPNQKHQLSYTLVFQRSGPAPAGAQGISDVAINYRYQLTGSGEARFAMSPRFSVILPTGDEAKGLGNGAAGFQVNVPASVIWSKYFVTHSNAGFTITPSAKNAAGQEADLKAFNLGQSVIWTPARTFNVMLETVWQSFESVTGPRTTASERSFLISPGVRWAHNFKSGLQVVPGIAVPLGAGPSRGERGVLFYLSFEHPFRKNRD